MSERRTSERVGRAAAISAAGLMAVTGAFEASKPAAAEAASGYENPVFARTDSQMKKIIKRINKLDDKDTKGVDIKHMQTQDGTKYEQYTVSAPAPGQKGMYDVFVALVDPKPTRLSEKNLPYASWIIFDAPNPAMSFTPGTSRLSSTTRSVFPEMTYKMHKMAPELKHPYNFTLKASNHNSRAGLDQFESFTEGANGILSLVDPTA